MTLYDNRKLLLKYAKDLSRAAAATLLTPGFQYSLRATKSGLYPIMIRGETLPDGNTHLNTGDIWTVWNLQQRGLVDMV